MKQKWRLTIAPMLALAFIVGLVSILVYMKVTKTSNGADNKKIEAAPFALPVNVFVAKGVTIENKISSIGTVLANEEVTLNADVSGKITGVFFEEASFVNKSKLLVKVDDSELQAELKRVVPRKELAEQNEKRQKMLLGKGAISQSEYDNALNELEVYRSEMNLIRARIAKTEVYAPFSGVVGLKAISPGSYITPANIISTLQDVSKLKIEFSVPERYAPVIRPGQKITYRIQGQKDGFEAKIYAIDPRVDQDTRTIMIRALSSNHASYIYPGAFAEVDLVLDKIENSVSLPSEAVIPDVRGHKVYLYKSGGVELRPVTLGARKEKEVEILSGVAIGDTVVSSGILQLRPGLQVSIKEVVN
jgi:membrane fusion protein, multidrug efflux system